VSAVQYRVDGRVTRIARLPVNQLRDEPFGDHGALKD
jgi:hypothetical protein